MSSRPYTRRSLITPARQRPPTKPSALFNAFYGAEHLRSGPAARKVIVRQNRPLQPRRAKGGYESTTKVQLCDRTKVLRRTANFRVRPRPCKNAQNGPPVTPGWGRSCVRPRRRQAS